MVTRMPDDWRCSDTLFMSSDRSSCRAATDFRLVSGSMALPVSERSPAARVAQVVDAGAGRATCALCRSLRAAKLDGSWTQPEPPLSPARHTTSGSRSTNNKLPLVAVTPHRRRAHYAYRYIVRRHASEQSGGRQLTSQRSEGPPNGGLVGWRLGSSRRVAPPLARPSWRSDRTGKGNARAEGPAMVF